MARGRTARFMGRSGKTPAEGAGRHALQRAELAVEVGEVAIADIVGDMGDRPRRVDEQRAGLADAELGDIFRCRQPGVAAEEAVEAARAEAGEPGERLDGDRLA